VGELLLASFVEFPWVPLQGCAFLLVMKKRFSEGVNTAKHAGGVYVRAKYHY
jgi:hypothetical protein